MEELRNKYLELLNSAEKYAALAYKKKMPEYDGFTNDIIYYSKFLADICELTKDLIGHKTETLEYRGITITYNRTYLW